MDNSQNEKTTPADTALTKVQWLEKCEKTLLTEGGLAAEDARQAALAALQIAGGNLSSDPQAAARRLMDEDADSE